MKGSFNKVLFEHLANTCAWRDAFSIQLPKSTSEQI
jgi:hypothetical protein